MDTASLASPRLVLASASPRRRDILASLGVPFEVDLPLIDELAGGLPPPALALENARRKARDVQCRRRQKGPQDPVRNPILAVDTIVVRAGIVLSKPISDQDARKMLNSLSGREHEVVSGLCLISGEGREVGRTCSTTVEFAPLTAAEIDWYLASGEHADKAGAYGIQGRAALFIRRVEGCYFNVVGLPVRTFYEALSELGAPLGRALPRSGGND
ncbi:MAG: septum formation protein Maf [Candidatus Riflebacteria bacterium]|nr:septum formation protein Maf [Candidatus Riflebacteria bacterium]